MKDIYEKIKNDSFIVDIYDKIHEYEDKDKEKGWAYHDYNHVLNVSALVEKLLLMLNYNDDLIYSAKIASILHDIGALQGKEIMRLEVMSLLKNTLKIII